MSVSRNTRPESIVDKNGKPTTVHKGRKPVIAAGIRASAVGAPLAKHTVDGVSIGDTFSAVYADGNITYSIISIKGELVVAEAEENEYGIGQRPFSLVEVKRIIDWERKFQNAQQTTDDFWDSIEVGKIVHYHSGFNQFVRAEVVLDDKTKKIKPIALIGNWDKYELPMRNPDGEIKNGYHAQSIIDGRLFAPNPSSIWEALTAEQRGIKAYDGANAAGGPANMPAIDITIPEMTAEESRLARIESLLGKFSEAATKWNVPLEERIESVKALIAQIEKES